MIYWSKVVTMYVAGAIGAVAFISSVFFLGTLLGFLMTFFGLCCFWFSSVLSQTLINELNNDKDA